MKVALVCKSDVTGGAAVVTFRLMNALRREGIDARMIVAEKGSGSDYVIEAATDRRKKSTFLAERLRVFAANGFDRKTLFQIDPATDGLPLHKIPFIKEADVICLNWVNQGILSLKGIRKLAALGKPIVWTMHDMWNMTGVCHHAGYCDRYLQPDGKCGMCPLLGKRKGDYDLSRKVWINKERLYKDVKIHFVAVSNWLSECARRSTLMRDVEISVIPNPFDIRGIEPDESMADSKGDFQSPVAKKSSSNKIIFGAARIDDPVKRHDILVEATRILADQYPEESRNLELVTFGGLKDPLALDKVGISHRHLGRVAPEDLRKIYEEGSVVVSTSEWETLPGTLVEGQAWGCVPVALEHGGQKDIIDHGKTGYLIPWSEDVKKNAFGIAEGILWGIRNCERIREDMRKSVTDRFSEQSVVESYINLFKSL